MVMGDYPPGVTGRETALNGIPDMWIPDDGCRYCCRCAVCGRDDEAEDFCCDAYEWNGELLELPKKPAKPKRSCYLSEQGYQTTVSEYKKNCRAWHAAHYEEG